MKKKHLLGVYGSRMSYIFNIVDFRLSPLLQDFPYFDICWTRIPETKHLLVVYGSRMSYIFNMIDFRLSPLLQDFHILIYVGLVYL